MYQSNPRFALPGYVPVVCHRMRRLFWVPVRYRSVLAVALSGPFTYRGLADRTGYSLHGAWAAVDSIGAMGIGHARAVRGCRGRTRLVVSSDASGNVPSTVTSPSRTGVIEPLMRREHSEPAGVEPVADGYGAWRDLRARLAGLAGIG